jgi:hypothetical protein
MSELIPPPAFAEYKPPPIMKSNNQAPKGWHKQAKGVSPSRFPPHRGSPPIEVPPPSEVLPPLALIPPSRFIIISVPPSYERTPKLDLQPPLRRDESRLYITCSHPSPMKKHPPMYGRRQPPVQTPIHYPSRRFSLENQPATFPHQPPQQIIQMFPPDLPIPKRINSTMY